jgi:hypothetical protein
MLALRRTLRIAAVLAVVGLTSSSAFAIGKDIRFGDEPARKPEKARGNQPNLYIPTFYPPAAVPAAPEIDPAALGSLAALLIGGGLLLRGRRGANNV